MSVGLPERYVIVVGAISPRKRQAEIAQALRGVCPLVAVGGWNGPGGRKEHFAQAVQETGGQWLGEIHQRSELNGLISGADALVHLSEAEGQSLAVMEALSLGTRCLLSDIPQQIELAERWPDQISIVGGVDEVVDALRSPVQSTFTPAEIPTWDEVAADLEMIYESIEAPKLLWDERS
jgi:glycosyltransferase involved in cell wall biosynthesis